jgi:hypothetical protein
MVEEEVPAPAGAPPMPDSVAILDSTSTGEPLQELAYVSFTVVSAPPEAEVYLVPEIDADRDPTILQDLTPSSPYYRGRTGANGLTAEDRERSYHLIVRHPSGAEDRRPIRLRRDETPTFNVQLR